MAASAFTSLDLETLEAFPFPSEAPLSPLPSESELTAHSPIPPSKHAAPRRAPALPAVSSPILDSSPSSWTSEDAPAPGPAPQRRASHPRKQQRLQPAPPQPIAPLPAVPGPAASRHAEPERAAARKEVPAADLDQSTSATDTTTIKRKYDDTVEVSGGSSPAPLVINHTRKCRQKVNNKFDELVAMMPDFKEDGKTKAKILDHATALVRRTLAANAALEAKIALSSRDSLRAWIYSAVADAHSIADAVAPVLSLVCHQSNWKFAELWIPPAGPAVGPATGPASVRTPAVQNHSEDARVVLHLARSFVRPDCSAEFKNAMTRFSRASKSFPIPASVGAPGRCFWTRKAEWLPSLNDPDIFLRSALVASTGLTCNWSVPVIVDGCVVACLSFFDTAVRTYDPHCVHAATDVAQTLCRAFNAKSDRSVVVSIPDVDVFA